jgi:pyridoxamine 5'-phosphate oxidase
MRARMKSVSKLREEYSRTRLEENEAAVDPLQQFRLWFDQAVAAEIKEPNAMTVATVSRDGRPSARMMLLKGFEDGRFVFYTNLASRKGRELESYPYAALVFFWSELERQVRIDGDVTRLSAAEANAYFASRPRGSQLGAWSSSQSQVVAGRNALEESFKAAEARFAGRAVERPPEWGGFALVPVHYEFWQGRPNRLHDRLLYTRETSGAWRLARLSP